ncbi:hypothetical protein Tco_0905529, partial [Tanacetum coccineum]
VLLPFQVILKPKDRKQANKVRIIFKLLGGELLGGELLGGELLGGELLGGELLGGKLPKQVGV